MTTKIKLILIGVIALIIGIFIYLLIHKQQVREAELEKEIYDRYKDSILYYKDLKGDTVYKISEKQDTDLSYVQQKKIDSLEKLLKVKPKETIKYVEISTTTDLKHIDSKIDSIKNDSIRYYSYADSYKDYEAVSTPGSLKFPSFNIYDTIHAVFVSAKVGNGTFNSLIIKNSNPDVKITTLQDIQVQPATEYSRIGLGLSVGYIPIVNKPYIGIGLNYNLIRFKKKNGVQ